MQHTTQILLPFKKLTQEIFFIIHTFESTTLILLNRVGKFILWLTLGSPMVWPTVYTIMHEISVQYKLHLSWPRSIPTYFPWIGSLSSARYLQSYKNIVNYNVDLWCYLLWVGTSVHLQYYPQCCWCGNKLSSVAHNICQNQCGFWPLDLMKYQLTL